MPELGEAVTEGTVTIAGLAIAAGRLVEKMRGEKLRADELSGGTFMVDNAGANVTMEAIVKRPVVIHDAIAMRALMNVCLSLDDRVIANAFTAEVKKRLEAMRPTESL